MKFIGLTLTFIALTCPLIWFLPLAAQQDPLALFSQYVGCFALIAMSIAQLFATRMNWLEKVYGGLDRIYVQHKWLGISAMMAVLLHDTIDAEMEGLGKETFLTDFAETLGEISLYGFLILVVITVTTFIPYHLWRFTHKLMGRFFAASAIHFALILKPFNNFDPLGIYVLSFCFLGIACYVYTLLPIGWTGAYRPYKISNLEKMGDALIVTMKPQGKGFAHRAGQFAFVSFDQPNLLESHPYTISQERKKDQSLRFSIKGLGAYTRQLPLGLKIGDGARVQGPFGHFQIPSRGTPQIWIAGGIGITPFISWAQSLLERTGQELPPVHLFYCVKSESDAYHLAELETLEARIPNFTVHLMESSKNRRLSADTITQQAGQDLSKSYVAFCGPDSMRDQLKNDLLARGLPSGRFLYEKFEIRSGIGLRFIASWLFKRMAPSLLNRLNSNEPISNPTKR